MKTIMVAALVALASALCSGYAIIESSPYEDHHLYHQHLEEHIPVIGKDGVPVDTPEVQEARRQHAVAHEEAKSRDLHYHHQLADYHEHGHEYEHEGHEYEHEGHFEAPDYHHLTAPHGFYEHHH